MCCRVKEIPPRSNAVRRIIQSFTNNNLTMIDETFNWDEVWATLDEPAPTTDTQEDELEQIYQRSTFSKKWAATRQEAIDKTLAEYRSAEQHLKTWQAKDYKANFRTVTVGTDYDERNFSIGGINDLRKASAIADYSGAMGEAIDTWKKLSLTQSEIDELTK